VRILGGLLRNRTGVVLWSYRVATMITETELGNEVLVATKHLEKVRF
jgi:hypothetical protein